MAALVPPSISRPASDLACRVAAAAHASTSSCPPWRPLPEPGLCRRSLRRNAPVLDLRRCRPCRPLQARRTREAVEEELVEEEDFEEEMESGLSEILSLVGFGVPAMLLGGLVLFGQLPVTLIMSLAVLPVLQKAAGPAIAGLWRFVNPPRRRKRPRWKRRRSQDEGADDSAYSTSWSRSGSSNASSEGSFYADATPAESSLVGSAPSSAEGWEQLVKREEQEQAEEEAATKPRPRRRTGSSAMARPRPGPSMLFRILLAFFPFLRSWGGFL